MNRSIEEYVQPAWPQSGMLPDRRQRESDITLAQVCRILRRRQRPVLACIALAIVLGVVYCLIAPRRYEATGRIAINNENSNPLGLTTSEIPLPLQDTSLVQETQVRILQSDSVAWDVIHQFHLEQSAEFRGTAEDSLNTQDARFRQRLLATFHRRLRVRSLPKTQIVEVSFRSADPQIAANVVNGVARAYVERNFRTRFEATQHASDWLEKQLDDLKSKVEAKQQEFIEFQKKTGIVGTDETHSIVLSRLDESNKHLAAAQAERIMREARYRQALVSTQTVLLEMAPTSALQFLRANEAQLKGDLAQLTAKYGNAYPKVLQLRSQLAQAQEALAAETANVQQRLEAEYRASAKAEAMALAEVDRQKQEAYKLNETGIHYLILKRELEGSRDLYEDLQTKLKEAGVVAGLRSTNVNVVDPAEIPVSPAEPRIPLTMTLATLLGTAIGVGLAFTLDSLDTTITHPEMAEQLARLPVLGVVPHIEADCPSAERAERSIHQLQVPSTYFAESFRVLRSTLSVSSTTTHSVVTVTSALPGEGKTLTSINLAIAVAQSGRKVLLVDGDLRRSPLHRRLGLDNTGGLSRCLQDGVEPEIVGVPEHPNLEVLPAGDPPASSSELLESQRMRELVHSWREKYDDVIIDTTPVLGLSDALALASLADAVLLVTRHRFTGRQSLCRARECLSRLNVRPVGIVFNDLDVNSASYYDYFGYYGRTYSRYYDAAIGAVQER